MAKRELLRKIDQDLNGAFTGGVVIGGTPSTSMHRMLSATHSDSDAGDVPVNGDLMVFQTLWKAMSLSEVIDTLGGLFVGRREGAHAGLFSYEHDDGTAIEFQVTDNGGQPFVSMGAILDVPNTTWIKIGYPEYDQIVLTDPTSGPTDPEQHRPLCIPAEALCGYLDVGLISGSLPAYQITIDDAGGYFVATDVEAALAELAAANPSVRYVTNTTTETAADRNGVIVCEKGSEMMVYLLAATGGGRHLAVKNIGAGDVIIDGDGGDTIDGQTMQYLSQWEAAQMVDYTSGAWAII